MMRYKTLLQLGIAGAACAVVLLAAEPWKTKEYTQWTDEEISKVLSDSPWAKEKTDHSDVAADTVDTVLKGTGFPMAKLDAVRGAIRRRHRRSIAFPIRFRMRSEPPVLFLRD